MQPTSPSASRRYGLRSPLHRDETRYALYLLAIDHDGIIGAPVQVVEQALSEATMIAAVDIGEWTCELHR